MKTTRRIPAIILAVLLFCAFVSGLSSCAEKPGGDQTVTTVDPGVASSGDTANVTEETVPDYDPKIAPEDWGGNDFTLIYNGNDIEPNMDFVASEINGSILNDAVYNRNLKIQDKHKLVIKPVFMKDSDIQKNVAASVKSGDVLAHLIEANQTYSMTMSINGELHELSALSKIDLSKPYWNNSFLSGSSIHGKNYFAYSDANVHAFGATPCTLFNKTVHKDFKLDNIYKIVEDGGWTFAVMSEMVKIVTGDLDGDQVITKDDRLGMIANTFCIDCFISGSGFQMVSKDENDLPVLNIINENFYSVLEGIKSLCAEENGMFLVDRISTTTEAREYWTAQALTDDRALFLIGNFKDVEKMRSTDTDFGVVPIPKYNSDQQDYMIHMQANIGAAMSVPVSTFETDSVSAILEDIAYESYLTVMPSYMEVVIQGQSIRDVESLKCIQMIRNSYYSDMGFMLGSYGINILDTCRKIICNNTDIVSTLTSANRQFKVNLKKLSDSIK